LELFRDWEDARFPQGEGEEEEREGGRTTKVSKKKSLKGPLLLSFFGGNSLGV